MTGDTRNPMLCDTETGVCAVPGGEARPVHVIYYTDPICSTCWGLEPALRKLTLEYADGYRIEHRMGGLLPSWDAYNSGGIGKPADVAHHWDEMSDRIGMPIDGDVWLEDALPSSYPPSIAFKAAQIQDEERALTFLRIVREMLFLEKKNITRDTYLTDAATRAGLDVGRFADACESTAIDLFKEDLQLGRALGVRGFPTLFFRDLEGNQTMTYGLRPYEELEAALLKANPSAVKRTYGHAIPALFDHYPTLTLREAVVLSGDPDAERVLNDMVAADTLVRFDTRKGSIWRLA